MGIDCMGANQITIESKATFEKFLRSSSQELTRIEQIDFWDLESFFPASEQEFQIFKKALSECTALKTLCFSHCKLYQLSVRDFKQLSSLFRACPSLKFLDLRHTVYELLINPAVMNNESRFRAFCAALQGCSNVTFLLFGENFCKQQIDENCFRYFISSLKTLKKLSRIDFDGDEFNEEQEAAINACINDQEPQRDAKEFEPQVTASGALFKGGFLNRRPAQIKAEELHKGGFLVSEIDRCDVGLGIKAQKKLQQRTYYYGFYNSVTGKEEYAYTNPNYDSFLEGANARLGKGVFGEAVAIQNVLTGKWYCKKKLAKGVLRSSEIEFLKEEGMFVSSESTSNEDVLIVELIHGKNLKTIMEEVTQKKYHYLPKLVVKGLIYKKLGKLHLKKHYLLRKRLRLLLAW
jgi:hypothetical protein